MIETKARWRLEWNDDVLVGDGDHGYVGLSDGWWTRQQFLAYLNALEDTAADAAQLVNDGFISDGSTLAEHLDGLAALRQGAGR